MFRLLYLKRNTNSSEEYFTGAAIFILSLESSSDVTQPVPSQEHILASLHRRKCGEAEGTTSHLRGTCRRNHTENKQYDNVYQSPGTSRRQTGKPSTKGCALQRWPGTHRALHGRRGDLLAHPPTSATMSSNHQRSHQRVLPAGTGLVPGQASTWATLRQRLLSLGQETSAERAEAISPVRDSHRALLQGPLINVTSLYRQLPRRSDHTLLWFQGCRHDWA